MVVQAHPALMKRSVGVLAAPAAAVIPWNNPLSVIRTVPDNIRTTFARSFWQLSSVNIIWKCASNFVPILEAYAVLNWSEGTFKRRDFRCDFLLHAVVDYSNII